ncbi:MAG: hypothetical protein H0X30_06945 [Anaerolineae bacterium]|nr:hypothetical protein [Anaerolineae bacterium]
MAKATIQQLYGENCIGRTCYAAKGNAQEAHECAGPTVTDVSPEACG